MELGKQIGAGAFGIVYEGIARGILPNEDESKVAVKMIQKIADNESIRALVMELKIMIHIGSHMNVVSLLGAITENIAQKELMVIVEYCRYGNLQSFLIEHRQRFLNQSRYVNVARVKSKDDTNENTEKGEI